MEISRGYSQKLNRVKKENKRFQVLPSLSFKISAASTQAKVSFEAYLRFPRAPFVGILALK